MVAKDTCMKLTKKMMDEVVAQDLSRNGGPLLIFVQFFYIMSNLHLRNCCDRIAKAIVLHFFLGRLLCWVSFNYCNGLKYK